MKGTVRHRTLKVNKKKIKIWEILDLSWANTPGMDR